MSSPPAGDMRWMAGFHNSIARPFASLYTRWALANLKSAALPNPTTAETTVSPDTPTEYRNSLNRSEEIRVFRVIYRYETFNHLFGRNKGRRRGGYPFYTINELFCCLFDPWEVEAIGCIDAFVREKYADIFNQIKGWMEGTVSRGLQIAVRMFTIDNYELLLAKMERAITTQKRNDDSFKKSLSTTA
ncbi:hypothetical protein BDP81DRAFT_517059 [Colletotrichum phormii]|uniref:Uncharacterized protein n=1 Tax=Colletotrichum phormii TaxID=359342 RepID=A0AAJ0EI58_9PEZI|nr:uncharacterized protein BDP81DRAFT_517059 [Colletotrichum phormii]KAK1637630.1 hypothetical protein BDP81DRAFT_517059 [Colletotrichum phormii]